MVIANFKNGMKNGVFMKPETMFLKQFSHRTFYTLKNN